MQEPEIFTRELIFLFPTLLPFKSVRNKFKNAHILAQKRFTAKLSFEVTQVLEY